MGPGQRLRGEMDGILKSVSPPKARLLLRHNGKALQWHIGSMRDKSGMPVPVQGTRRTDKFLLNRLINI